MGSRLSKCISLHGLPRPLHFHSDVNCCCFVSTPDNLSEWGHEIGGRHRYYLHCASHFYALVCIIRSHNPELLPWIVTFHRTWLLLSVLSRTRMEILNKTNVSSSFSIFSPYQIFKGSLRLNSFGELLGTCCAFSQIDFLYPWCALIQVIVGIWVKVTTKEHKRKTVLTNGLSRMNSVAIHGWSPRSPTGGLETKTTGQEQTRLVVFSHVFLPPAMLPHLRSYKDLRYSKFQGRHYWLLLTFMGYAHFTIPTRQPSSNRRYYDA